jgi:hypothetical protein
MPSSIAHSARTAQTAGGPNPRASLAVTAATGLTTTAAGGAPAGWSPAATVQNTQLLAYMIAIPDAKAVMDRIRNMRSGGVVGLWGTAAGMWVDAMGVCWQVW